ncbi:MAG: NUDIX domain-containing protein [Patescibacteria group bacterium]|nr:NUDIX domain-containing protein [Patescibacteria group bacterium]
MSQAFSPIQNHIISKLKNARSLRYSELWPEKVPNDLFNYHLQFLVKKGFVDRTEDGYSLSAAGVKHVADFNPAKDDSGVADLFKVNVLTIISRIKDKEIQILNQVRHSNPSYGKVGIMGGVVRKGESIEDAAKRKLQAETGLIADFKLVGIQRRILYVKGELFSDVIFPIAYADEYEGELLEKTEYGENRWVGIDEAIKNDAYRFDSIKMLPKALEAVKNGTILKMPFFYDEDTQSGELMK